MKIGLSFNHIKVIALMGLGDELMAAGEAQNLSKMNNGERVAILDGPKGKPRWHAIWQNNPYISKPGKEFKLSIVNCSNHRGYIQKMMEHRWVWREYKPIPAELFFSKEEKQFAEKFESDFVIIEPNLRKTDVRPESVNRNWGWDNFVALCQMLPSVNWVQVGSAGTKVLPGAKLIETECPRMAAAIIARAKSFVSHEGGLHHMAAAVGLKGVVIYGGFISQYVTGYSMHSHLFVGSGIGCGSRGRCLHCKTAMKSITPSVVALELNSILNVTPSRTE